ncbi:conjugative transfer ATPase, PFL_4706 family protein [Thiosulfatimonas sediminis]|uniref:Conjugative transfer ATPase, PFL_4706 family protein n=1 Tax=Thiosulfatimonas sediminis TaxID=2675054 RepID=A0A6F8PW93_9GAMM|nr:conjugative transfer ATPase [Thiosulfatimonas sediminis]BBP46307.1 conjugative transfer ATPase, PFL_4706 family protein [Thiosulfatimonas sediminis]
MKFLDRIFGLGQNKAIVNEPKPDADVDAQVVRWSGLGKIPFTEKQWSELITSTPEQQSELAQRESFVDLMQVKTMIGDEVMLRDGKTVGAAFEITPVEADGRTPAFMANLHNKIMSVLRESIPRDLASPWVVQITMQDDADVSEFAEKFDGYGHPDHDNQAFRTEWIRVLKEHLNDVADPNGVFVDEMVSGANWFVRYRKVRVYLWRKKPNTKKDFAPPLQSIVDQMTSRFKAAGIGLKRLDIEEMYRWYSHFFVPTGTEIFGQDFNKYLDKNGYSNKPDFEDMVGMEDSNTDLAESSLHGTRPFSDDQGNWYFTGKARRFITIQEANAVPNIGHISAELENGDKRIALWDGMPIGAIWSQVLVFVADDEVDAEIAKYQGSVLGNDERVDYMREKIAVTRRRIAEGDVVVKSLMGVYVTADNAKDMDYKARMVTTALDSASLKTVPLEYDMAAQDTFIRALPFNYNYLHDKKPSLRRARKYFIRQVAKLVPFYGRSRGTENPGFLFYNRGGEPFAFDPIRDRVKNAFALILGPTGSGKSALLNYLIAQYVAFYNAQFFIIEKGKSFYLLGKFLKRFGVTVNQIIVSPSSPISLNPFATAVDLNEVKEELGLMTEEQAMAFEREHDLIIKAEEDEIDLEEGDEDDAQRDELGEMTLAAITMITGGEEKELNEIRRHERFDIMQAIIKAGKDTQEKGYTLTEDIANALDEMALDTETYVDARRDRLKQFADNLRIFCTGVRGDFFNRQGEPWPDADVTIFDIGMMINAEYADMLGVSMVSMLNRVISIAEANQHNKRPIIALADEGHITTTNPLIAPIVTNMTKMARKLGLWFWLATQNLADFKDTSAKMLSNMEWWVTMSTTQDEVDQISRFKPLNEDQKSMLLAARKEPGKYTEGVVLSDRVLSLFRNVPPALAMALAQTETDEKVVRKELMEKHGVTELEAAYMVAEKMKQSRKGMKDAA